MAQSVDHIPPPPPTIPASPRAIALELEPAIERIVSRVIDVLGARIDELERKSAARHKLVVNRIGKIERELKTLDARVTALETTRIVLRGITASSTRRRPKRRGHAARKG